MATVEVCGAKQGNRDGGIDMPSNDPNRFDQATKQWHGGQALEAGRLLLENLPTHLRPIWASNILRLVLGRSGVDPSLFHQVLYTAEHQPMWANGHRTFSILRNSVLELDELERTIGLTKEQKLLKYVLHLAELVAKVTYNAVSPPDEFDEDSGWSIAASLRGFVDHYWREDKFAQAAWSALTWHGNETDPRNEKEKEEKEERKEERGRSSGTRKGRSSF